MLTDWAISKLETVKESPRVLVRDPLHLLPEADGVIHSFAREHGYTVIIAATNLVFRELYERAIADPETKKLLVIDRSPLRRRVSPSSMKAPPVFYPDLLAETPEDARIDLDLRQFLKETTGDPHWPAEANDPRYARLIARHLGAVLRAYRNLRTAHPERFTDHDFKTIVAFAALGVPDAAFKKLDPEDYWRIGLLGHEALEELEALAPEVTKPIREVLVQAEKPFCWFGSHAPDIVVRAFYLSVIVSQHLDNWNVLLANIDPTLGPLTGIEPEILREAAPRLVRMDSVQAARDVGLVERSLNRDALQFLLVDHMHVTGPAGFAMVVEKERYSTLVRSLALLSAVDDLLSNQPAWDEHFRIAAVLFPEGDRGESSLVETRSSLTWSHLKAAYKLARDIQHLRGELTKSVKLLGVRKSEQLTFTTFRELWNDGRLNRLEYYLSALERLVNSADLLPRNEDELPSVLGNALDRIRQRVRSITEDVQRQLEEVNRRFQDMVALQYPSWIQHSGDGHRDAPCLTSQFLRRCLKPHWDPQHEKAVVFIFDGMRYDIWDELLRPTLEDRMEVIADLPAASLLPSETKISRWALSAGAEPQQFWPPKAENEHLKEALSREFNYHDEVEIAPPQGSGTGETVRYRAGNLEVYIFEFCDKELHKIQMKTHADGRKVPGRPLSFVYEQVVKNIIDTEVMAIVRRLAPGTKVFVTADHGFGTTGREPLWFAERDLNEKADCTYSNCWLKVPIEQANLSAKVRKNIIVFTPEQLRLPTKESRTLKKTGETFHKEYKAIAFPKVGYSFSRQGSHFNPDAYTHGGISVQELMIPMVVLRVKTHEAGMVMLDPISGPREVVEGEEAEFRMRLHRSLRGGAGADDLRVDVEATYGLESERSLLPRQVLYVPVQGEEVVYRFQPNPDDATPAERRQGTMDRTLTVAVSYREDHRTVRKSQTHRFSVRLNSAQVIRRVGNLGNILGLTPKSLR